MRLQLGTEGIQAGASVPAGEGAPLSASEGVARFFGGSRLLGMKLAFGAAAGNAYLAGIRWNAGRRACSRPQGAGVLGICARWSIVPRRSKTWRPACGNLRFDLEGLSARRDFRKPYQ